MANLKQFNKKIIMLITFCVCSILVELVTFIYMRIGVLPQYIFFDLAGIFFIAFVLMMIPNSKASMITGLVILIIQTIISFVNTNMVSVTGEVFSWDMLSIINEGARAVAKGFDFTFLYLLCLVPIYALFVFVYKKTYFKKEKQYEYNYVKKSITVGFILLLFAIIFYSGEYNVLSRNISEDSNTVISDKYLMDTNYVKQQSLKKFGYYGYYFSSGYKMVLSLVEDPENNEELTKINEYFAEYGTTDNSNEFSGISENNNLIFILYETWDYSGINKYLTPNLYELFTNSLVMSEYYSKDQTNISEGKTIFGSYPLTQILNYNYSDNYYPQTLPNMFRSKYSDAEIVSFHNNDGDYYSRNECHIHYGFDKHIDATEMDLTENELWINLDSQMFSSTLMTQEATSTHYIIPEDTSKPFLSYITTFTTHGPFIEREELQENYEIIKNYEEDYNEPYTTFLGHEIDLTDQRALTYIAASMDVDKGIGYLLDELEQRGLKDNTTIVMMSDHFAYYNSYAHNTKGYEGTDTSEIQVYHVPALIYDTKLYNSISKNSSLQEKYNIGYQTYNDDEILVSKKFFTNQDILPTILNLFAIPYNSACYLGCDLFSEHESIILSRWGGIFNNRFYSVDGLNIEKLPEDYIQYIHGALEENEEYLQLTLDIEQFVEKVTEYLIKQEIINRIYEYDYYKYAIEFDQKVSSLTTITKDSKNILLELQTEYEALIDVQKMFVKNYDEYNKKVLEYQSLYGSLN